MRLQFIWRTTVEVLSLWKVFSDSRWLYSDHMGLSICSCFISRLLRENGRTKVKLSRFVPFSAWFLNFVVRTCEFQRIINYLTALVYKELGDTTLLDSI